MKLVSFTKFYVNFYKLVIVWRFMSNFAIGFPE